MVAVNPLRGEVKLLAGKKTYKLVFDANALILAEEALKPLTTDEIIERVEETRNKVDLKLIRALVWGALQKHHECHLIAAGEIISDAGAGHAKAAVYDGLAAAFGMAKEDKEPSDPPSPPHAGTG